MRRRLSANAAYYGVNERHRYNQPMELGLNRWLELSRLSCFLKISAHQIFLLRMSCDIQIPLFTWITRVISQHLSSFCLCGMSKGDSFKWLISKANLVTYHSSWSKPSPIAFLHTLLFILLPNSEQIQKHQRENQGCNNWPVRCWDTISPRAFQCCQLYSTER